MKYHDLEPIQKPHSNTMIGGRAAYPNEENIIGGKVNGLPVTLNEQRVVSVWKCRSIWKRLQFLIHGEITLTILGQQHPAICVSLNDTLSCENEKSATTGNERNAHE